jgi:hypothetical protein
LLVDRSARARNSAAVTLWSGSIGGALRRRPALASAAPASDRGTSPEELRAGSTGAGFPAGAEGVDAGGGGGAGGAACAGATAVTDRSAAARTDMAVPRLIDNMVPP